VTNHKHIVLKRMILPTGFVTLLRQHELMEFVHNFENGNENYTSSVMALTQLCSVQFKLVATEVAEFLRLPVGRLGVRTSGPRLELQRYY
jgi:hypothetical protein